MKSAMKLRCSLATVSLCLAAGTIVVPPPAAGAPEDPIPASFHQGFEGKESRPAKVLAADGAYEIHEIASVEDSAAAEGAQSLRVDITLKSGSYLYLSGPMRVRPLGSSTLSARVRLDSPWPERMRLQMGAGFDDPAADRN